MSGAPREMAMDETSTPVWEQHKAQVLKELGAKDAYVEYWTWTQGGMGDLFTYVGKADGKGFKAAIHRNAPASRAVAGADWFGVVYE